MSDNPTDPTKPLCKTCGGTPNNHKPSLLDSEGIGNPGHRITKPTHKKLNGVDGYYGPDVPVEPTNTEPPEDGLWLYKIPGAYIHSPTLNRYAEIEINEYDLWSYIQAYADTRVAEARRPSKFKKYKAVAPTSGSSVEVTVLGIVEGYAVVRRKGAMPFLIQQTRLAPPNYKEK